MKKNVIFIGSIHPLEREIEIKENSKLGVDKAANNFQAALLSGLDYYFPNLKVITLPVIRTYPNGYRKCIFRKSKFSHLFGKIDYCVGFINIPLVKHLSRYANLLKLLTNITTNEETVVILYAVHSPFLKAVYQLKKSNPKLKVCLIIPDLPQFMTDNRNPVYRFFKQIDFILIEKYLKKIDSFVFLTDSMSDVFKLDGRPWTRVEGLFLETNLYEKFKKGNLKIVLYSGTLAKQYGVSNLIDAFCSIKDIDFRLWICGDGDFKDEIINRSNIDNRIKFLGQISFEDVQKLQKQATVLVNPRTSEGDYTKYSFPSKTMEYIASGTPSIMHRLPGIPNEYYNYVFVCEREDAVGLKDMILTVCNKDQTELNEFGRKASKFILENKNPIVQVKKIYDMINTL